MSFFSRIFLGTAEPTTQVQDDVVISALGNPRPAKREGTRPSAPVMFDVKNPAHRKFYKLFLENNKWPHDCPSFILRPPYQCLPAMINYELLTFYLNEDTTI